MRHEPHLDCHVVSDSPAPLYIGELPRHWGDVPARLVINVCGTFPQGDPLGRMCFSMPMRDVLDPNQLPRREDLERFLASIHLHAADQASYWHCHAGINRSAMAAAAYLHLHRGLRISEAIRTIRERRSPTCLCNAVFERVLREWYGGPDEQDFDPVSFERWAIEHLGK